MATNLGDLALASPLPRVGQQAHAIGSGAGNFTTASATFVDLTGMSVTIGASTSDNVFVAFSANYSLNAVQTSIFQAVAVGSGTTIQLMGYNNASAGLNQLACLLCSYILVAGDISGGNATIKIQVETTGAATLTVQNGANMRVPMLTVINLGQ